MKRIVVVLTLLMAIGASVLVYLSLAQSEHSLAQSEHSLAQSEHKIVNYAGDTPTVVQQPASAEIQHQRAMMFPNTVRDSGGASLLDRMPPDGGGIISDIPEYGPDPDFYFRTSDRFITDQTNEADLVVTGTVVRKSSAFTEGNQWIYSDYSFSIGDVLKQDSRRPKVSNETITVSNPSGTVEIDGREIYALDQSNPPLTTNGARYVVFLKYISDVDCYVLLERWGAFINTGGALAPVSKERLPIRDAKGSQSRPMLSTEHVVELVRSLRN
jgi:hypothetical protein